MSKSYLGNEHAISFMVAGREDHDCSILAIVGLYVVWVHVDMIGAILLDKGILCKFCAQVVSDIVAVPLILYQYNLGSPDFG